MRTPTIFDFLKSKKKLGITTQFEQSEKVMQYNFERKEIKYILTEDKYKELIKALSGIIEPDEYGKTLIQNIYYDTPNFSLIKRSLEHPVYKEKLRIRKYGTAGDKVFIEIKKKYEGIVYKRRICGKYDNAIEQLNKKEPPDLEACHKKEEEQIQREIGYFIKRYQNLEPAMKITYNRTAYRGIKDRDFRVTFDDSIRYNSEEVLFKSENDKDFDNVIIMEVKATKNYDYEFAHILSSYEIFPSSFSKYGRCYEETLWQ